MFHIVSSGRDARRGGAIAALSLAAVMIASLAHAASVPASREPSRADTISEPRDVTRSSAPVEIFTFSTNAALIATLDIASDSVVSGTAPRTQTSTPFVFEPADELQRSAGSLTRGEVIDDKPSPRDAGGADRASFTFDLSDIRTDAFSTSAFEPDLTHLAFPSSFDNGDEGVINDEVAIATVPLPPAIALGMMGLATVIIGARLRRRAV